MLKYLNHYKRHGKLKINISLMFFSIIKMNFTDNFTVCVA